MPTTTRLAKYLSQLDKYCVTSHGANPRTAEATRNMFTTLRHFEAAVALVGGTVSSGYRGARVNKIVGGAATSRHMRGLALDIIPAGDVEAAAFTIWHAAIDGDLGMVQQVIREPGWVHIGWYAVGEIDRGLTYLRKTATGYQKIETWVG